MKKISRKNFLKLGLVMYPATLSMMSSCTKSTDNFFLVGWKADLYKFPSINSFMNGIGFNVSNISLSNMTHDLLEIKQDRVLAIPKWGKKVDVVNTKTMKIEKTIACEGNEEFMGHGVVDHKRGRIYISVIESSMVNYEISGKGFIHQYDLKSLTLINKFDSYGSQPHELALIGDNLIVLNPSLNIEKKSNKPNIAIISLDSKKLVQSFVPKDLKLLYSHLVKIDDENVFIINERAEGDDDNPIIAIRYSKGEFKYVNGPNKIFNSGGLLSTDVGNKTVMASAPQDDCVFIWNQKDFSFLKSVKLNNPKAVSYDKNLGGYVVGCSDGIFLIYEDSLKLSKLYNINFGESSSSHGLIL